MDAGVENSPDFPLDDDRHRDDGMQALLLDGTVMFVTDDVGPGVVGDAYRATRRHHSATDSGARFDEHVLQGGGAQPDPLGDLDAIV